MLNKVTLIGRLGQDPEVRYMPNSEPVCNFSIATDENWKDAQGQKQSRTEWHNITMYRKLAEIAQKWLKKGSLVYLEGKIQSRKYTSKDGIERTVYEIIGNDMKMLGSKGEQSQEPHSATQAHSTAVPPPQARPTKPIQPQEYIDDDIPF